MGGIRDKTGSGCARKWTSISPCCCICTPPGATLAGPRPGAAWVSSSEVEQTRLAASHDAFNSIVLQTGELP
jgi:hypothetical protein